MAGGWWLVAGGPGAWRGRDALPRVRRCMSGNRRSPFNLNARLLARFVQVLSMHVYSCSYGRATPDARERIPITPLGLSPNPILFLNEWQETGLFDSGQRREECDLYDAGVSANFDPARNRSTVHNLRDSH